MPAETTLIYDDLLVPAAINASDPFTDGSFFWFDAPSIPDEAEVAAFLQIEVLPGTWRNVPMEQNRVNTAETFLYPVEYRNSGYDCRLVVVSDEAIAFRVYLVKSDECPELKALDTKINFLLAGSIVSKLIDVAVPLLTGGVETLLIDAVAGGALRAGLKILNPGTSPVYVGLGDTASPTDYDYVLPPGGWIETPFQGDIFAFNPSADAIPLTVKMAEFDPDLLLP